jgi:hypothetical protein
LSVTDGNVAGGGPFMIKKVFTIAMENQGIGTVYGNDDAPYIGRLMALGGHATMYEDVLAASVPSEPHYVWLEAGTNSFADHIFTSDDDASARNSTSSGEHLVTQLAALATPKSWRSYQQGLNEESGACPIASSDQYAAKHDPFVFFRDVAGDPPDKSNVMCAEHHRAYSASRLQADLAADDVADYTFITPDLCNDMHGGLCLNGCLFGSVTTGLCVKAGDDWLAAIVPSILDYVDTHDGVLMIVWDEPEGSGAQPFLIVGPHVKAGYASDVSFSHSSYLKTLQRILGVPIFVNVSSANDFSDFYEAR